jgi:hypothetical protein
MSLGLESLMRQVGCETGYTTPKYGPRFISSRTNLVVICDNNTPKFSYKPILNQTMTSQSVPSSLPIEAVNAYDDNSFINEDNSRQEHEGGSTLMKRIIVSDVKRSKLHMSQRSTAPHIVVTVKVPNVVNRNLIWFMLAVVTGRRVLSVGWRITSDNVKNYS